MSSNADAILTILSEVKGKDPEIQRQLIYQIIPFFNEILANNTEVTSKNESVNSATSRFIISVSNCLQSLLESPEDINKITYVIISLIHTRLTQDQPECVTQLVSCLIQIKKDRDNAVVSFIPLVEEFFTIPDFRSQFVLSGGLEIAWQLNLQKESYLLIPVVMQQFLCFSSYFSSQRYKIHITNSLRKISISICEISVQKVLTIFKYLYSVALSCPTFYIEVYEEVCLFNTMGAFLLQDNNSESNNDFFDYFIKFALLYIKCEKSDLPNTPMNELVDMVTNTQCTNEYREKCFIFFLHTVKKEKMQLSIDKINQIGRAIPLSESQNIALYSEICFNLLSTMKFETYPTIPTLLLFCTNNELLTSSNYSFHYFLDIFISINEKFHPFSLMLFGPLFDLPSEKIESIFCNNEKLYILLEQFFQCSPSFDETKSFFDILLNAFTPNFFIQNNAAIKTLVNILLIEKQESYAYLNGAFDMVEILLNKKSFDKSINIFQIIMSCANANNKISTQLIKQKIVDKIVTLYSKYHFPSKLLFNFISTLANHRYMPDFDDQIYFALKKYNYFDETPENTLLLALGLQIKEKNKKCSKKDIDNNLNDEKNEKNKKNEEENQRIEVDTFNSTLCFPSIWHHCAPFKLSLEYDLWLLGYKSLDIWLKENKDKKISDFPQIADVARIYIYPRHAKMILKDCQLAEEVFKFKIKKIPLFEYPPLNNEILFEIPFDDAKTVTFWFSLNSFSSNECEIVTLESGSLTIFKNLLFYGGVQFGTMEVNIWQHIAITFDNSSGNYIFYLNSEQKFIQNGQRSKKIIFGSKNSTVHWLLGGAVRTYHETLNKKNIEKIFVKNVNFGDFSDLNEKSIHTAFSVVPIFKEINQASIQKSRPIIYYSLFDYVQLVLKGASQFFIRAIDSLQKKEYSNALSLINSLCYLHKFGTTLWENKEFALYTSIICSFDSPMITHDLVDAICKGFIDQNNASFDWESFFIFALDFRFFLSDLAHHIISCFNHYNDTYPLPPYSIQNKIFVNFLLHLVIIPDIQNELRPEIFNLIILHCKDPCLILQTIISCPDFSLDLQNYSSKYEFKMNKTIHILFNILYNLPIQKFESYHILYLLEPRKSFELINHLMNHCSEIKGNEILKFCYDNISYLDAWDIAFSIFLNKIIRIENFDLDFSTFDMKYIAKCLKFLTPLSFVALRSQENAFWKKLCIYLFAEISKIVGKQTEYDPRMVKHIYLMMSLGEPLNKIDNLPLYPSEKFSEEIINNQNSHSIRDHKLEEPKFLTYPFSLKNSKTLNLSAHVPRNIYLTSGSAIQMNTQFEELSKDITNNQICQNDYSWNEYLVKLYTLFGIEKTDGFEIRKSNIVDLIIDLVIKEMSLFNQTIIPILSAYDYFPHDLTQYWMNRVVNEMYMTFEKSNIFSQTFLQFICERVNDGWLSSNIVFILSKISTFAKNSIRSTAIENFYQCVLFSFEKIPENDVTKLGDIIAENESLFLISDFVGNLKFVLLLISRVFSFSEKLSNNFSMFWLKFMGLCIEYDSLNSKLKAKYPDLDFLFIFDKLKELDNQKINVSNLKRSNYGVWELLNDIFEKQNISFSEEMNRNILTSSIQFIEERSKNDQVFENQIHHIILSNSRNIVFSKTIATGVRYFTRRSLLASTEFFLRSRECIISKTIPFNESTSNHYSMSILSDPILPTRRKTLSPLEYETPSFPSSLVNNIFEYSPNAYNDYCLFPECVKNCLSFCRRRIPSILRRSPKSIHARFSASTNIGTYIDYQLFLNICHKGRPFIYQCDTSLLYGVDVIEGTVFFDNDHLYFFEGARIINKNQLHHIHTDENESSQAFYIQCFQSNIFSHRSLTFRGHFILISSLSQIISATNHLWIQRPFSISLCFSMGYNFVLNFSPTTYNEAYSLISKGVSKFFESAPPETHFLSPIKNARLLQENVKKLMQLWSEGLIDNFTYLCLINIKGKRSYADLTQYPVFPWILSDFVSNKLVNDLPVESFRDLTKPMGQITEERAVKFEETYEDSNHTYFYGTHYSHIGVVLYFMFRIDPFSIFSFSLYRGWDHPNRIFSKISDTWLIASTKSSSDFKELIPQMYKVPDFLINNLNCMLEANCTSHNLNIVKLPKWSTNPRHFTYVNCRFLECEYVCSNLHNWIDLIFGVNSRGDGAKATKNLFHPNCYPENSAGSYDPEDQIEKQAIITSIINFGQCSPQIFFKPHLLHSDTYFGSNHLLTRLSALVYQNLNKDVIDFPISDFYIASSSITFSSDLNSVVLPSHQILHSNQRTLGNIALSKDGFIICRSFIDGRFTISRLSYKGSKANEKLLMSFITKTQIQEIAVSTEHFIAIAAYQKKVLLFDIGTKKKLPCINFDFFVKHIAIDDEAAVFWVTGGNNICLCTISGEIIIQDMLSCDITAICASPLPEYSKNRFTLVGHSDGSLTFLGVIYRDMKFATFIKLQPSNEPIKKIKFDPYCQRAIIVSEFSLFDIEYIGTKAKALDMKYAAKCINCSELVKFGLACSKCNRFICPKCIKKDAISDFKLMNRCSTCKLIDQ